MERASRLWRMLKVFTLIEGRPGISASDLAERLSLAMGAEMLTRQKGTPFQRGVESAMDKIYAVLPSGIREAATREVVHSGTVLLYRSTTGRGVFYKQGLSSDEARAI